MSALAEFPNRVKSLFISTKVNENAHYELAMFINGHQKVFELDDNFVYDPDTDNFAFSSTKEDELWVQLLEKCWAKACGTYAKTIGGHASQALRALTGAPSEAYQHDSLSVDELWNLVKEADQKNYVMCTSVGSEDYQNEHQSKGLATFHAYTLIGCAEGEGN